MPTISKFYGIVVRMYWMDHARPHIHAFYSGYEAAFSVSPAAHIDGDFPVNAKRLVLQWIRLYRADLLEDWELAESGEPLRKIPGLE